MILTQSRDWISISSFFFSFSKPSLWRKIFRNLELQITCLFLQLTQGYLYTQQQNNISSPRISGDNYTILKYYSPKRLEYVLRTTIQQIIKQTVFITGNGQHVYEPIRTCALLLLYRYIIIITNIILNNNWATGTILTCPLVGSYSRWMRVKTMKMTKPLSENVCIGKKRFYCVRNCRNFK